MSSAIWNALSELDVTTRVHDRPESVPGDLRGPWRVGLLLLLLDRCYGKSATLEQVHVVGWALLGREGRDRLSAALNGIRPPDSVLVRYDPAWSRTVDLAVGLGLTEWVQGTGRLRLSEQGQQAADQLWAEESLFVDEVAFLKGQRVSQAMIDRLLESR